MECLRLRAVLFCTVFIRAKVHLNRPYSNLDGVSSILRGRKRIIDGTETFREDGRSNRNRQPLSNHLSALSRAVVSIVSTCRVNRRRGKREVSCEEQQNVKLSSSSLDSCAWEGNDRELALVGKLGSKKGMRGCILGYTLLEQKSLLRAILNLNLRDMPTSLPRKRIQFAYS